MMVDYAREYPGYGWEHNRGYPTPDHRRAINDLGLTPLHRRSFGLVRRDRGTTGSAGAGVRNFGKRVLRVTPTSRLSPATVSVTQHLVGSVRPAA